MALTTEQESLLDATGVVVNAYLYAHVPELVFSAPLAGSDLRKKAYVALIPGTPTFGALSDINPEMTVQIDIDGYADGGRQRVRGVDGSNILIGRTGAGYSDGRLDVKHGGTIRVYRQFLPFVKALHIDLATLDIRKDETLYPGDNEAQPPVAVAGPDRLIVTDDATASITLDASRSFAVRNGATIASYLWSVRDGTITSGVNTDASITVSYPRGERWIRLRVTDSNGVTQTTRRLVVVARPEDCVPVRIDTLSMKADGNDVTVTVEADRLPEGLPQGAKVIIAERENYGTRDLVGYRERFSGWLGTETAVIDNARRGNKPITITLHDASAFLKQNYLFPQSINIAEDTGGWYQMPDPNIDRFCHHLLHWHTNLLELCDFEWSGVGSTYPFSALTTSGGSFWSNVEGLVKSFAHKFTCNSRSQLQVLPDPHIQPTTEQKVAYVLPTNRPTGVVTTLSEDRYTTMSLAARKEPETYWFEAQAIIAAETVNSVVAAIAPSNAPNTGSSGASRTDLLVTTLEELRVWAGNQYAAEYGSHVGDLTVTTINPSHFIEPADCQFVAIELPERYADRYNLPPDAGNRWTVESIEYTYGDEGKRATYRLRKEIVAPEPAKPTEQTDTDSIVQAWDGFDDSISPTTGNIIRNFEASTMSLTQAQLEQTLRRTWLKVGVGAVTIGSGGSLDIDDDGNVTDPDGDGGSDVGAGSLAEQAERNGGMYEVARRLADFWSKAQTVWNGVTGDADEQVRFEQFVNATLTDVDPTAVTAWYTYINGTPDTTLPSLTLTQRETLTGIMYCAVSLKAGLTEYVTSLSSTLWDRYFTALDVITEAQLQEWYDAGTDTPVNLFSSYACYIYPPETLELNTTQIINATVVQGNSKNWSTRAGGSTAANSHGSFVYIEASGQYEDATHIKDAFYTFNKSTLEVTYSPLTYAVSFSHTGGAATQAITFPTPPPYSEAGTYAVTGRVYQPTFHDSFAWASGNWSATKYRLSDGRSPAGTGTGAFEVTFTDLGKI